MFERNRIDNSLQQAAVPAELTLTDGSVLKGKFVIAASRSIYEVLNGDTQFVEFECHQGLRSLIAKASVKNVKLVTLGSTAGLANRMREPDAFDPHVILGVARGAPWDSVRNAYMKLSKSYHPDRYAGVDLPDEVSDYLLVMSRRINAAYGALEEPQQEMKRAAIEKPKPIYVSPQRF